MEDNCGIEYIKIVGEYVDSQFQLAEAIEPFTEKLVRGLFKDSGMELNSGYKITECEKGDLIARYDLNEGIDKILNFIDGTKGTLQQKILFTDYKTITFEKVKNSGRPGAYCYCTAQYYLTIYTVESRSELMDQYKNKSLKPTFRDAILLNLPSVHRATLTPNTNKKLIMEERENYRNGRHNAFYYTHFDRIPEECVLSRYCNGEYIEHIDITQRQNHTLQENSEYQCSTSKVDMNVQYPLF